MKRTLAGGGTRSLRTTAKTRKRRKRDRHLTLKVDKPVSDSNETTGKTPFLPLTKAERKVKGPANWVEVYTGIRDMRLKTEAAVDTIGCACLATPEAPIRIQRFHIFVGLLLSSQTKDQTTSQAVANLKKKFDGLTPEAIASATEEEIDECISKVGFHKRKAHYLKLAGESIVEAGGEIPNTLEGLCSMKGYGPKMAMICLQVAWNKNCGIGVDVHLHRIVDRLGWTEKCKTPEQTRKSLEKWLPKRLWPGFNPMMVGFGQTICRPKNPFCDRCSVKNLCPVGKTFEARQKLPKDKKKKMMKKKKSA